MPRPASAAGAARRPADPVQQRRGAKIPVASFGIGGKLVVYLPSADSAGDAYGYDAPRRKAPVCIHALNAYVGPRAISAFDLLRFPGPLFEGPRSTTSSAGKQKKAAVLHFLHEQISEAASGVGYLRRKSTLGPMRDSEAYQAGVEEWRRTEDRILLLKLLSLLVEHNGRLLEDPALARTVSNMLQGKTDEGEGFSAFAVPTYGSTPHGGKSRPLRTYALRQSFLDELQGLLQAGECEAAVDLALRERMWAHALAVAQHLGQTTKDRVMQQFMHYELDSSDQGEDSMLKDRTSVKVAYALYSHLSLIHI